ncbi:hypothetical protein D3C86_1220270 [compost metagenome]
MIIFISGFRIKSETFRSERFNEVLHKKAQSRRHLRSANEKNTLRSWGFRIKSETFRSERFNELLYKKNAKSETFAQQGHLRSADENNTLRSWGLSSIEKADNPIVDVLNLKSVFRDNLY